IMYMRDYIKELDNILNSTGRKILKNAGKISSKQAKEKANLEYKAYKAKILSPVEKEYLNNIKAVQKIADKESKKR
ncbi:MAG: virulence RhuM family protein, partial [Sulfurospirillum sp.]|nr:virulence RhuM family protein [Sulfurospirillum sp.]